MPSSPPSSSPFGATSPASTPLPSSPEAHRDEHTFSQLPTLGSSPNTNANIHVNSNSQPSTVAKGQLGEKFSDSWSMEMNEVGPGDSSPPASMRQNQNKQSSSVANLDEERLIIDVSSSDEDEWDVEGEEMGDRDDNQNYSERIGNANIEGSMAQVQIDKMNEGHDDEANMDEIEKQGQDLSFVSDSTLEHDTAEDVMNLPPSYVAPSHRPRDLHDILSGDREPTEDEIEAFKERRQKLEAQVKAEITAVRLAREIDGEVSPISPSESLRDAHLRIPSSDSGPGLAKLQEEAGAVKVAPGVVVVDPEQLDHLLSVANDKMKDDKKDIDAKGLDGKAASSPVSPHGNTTSIQEGANQNEGILEAGPSTPHTAANIVLPSSTYSSTTISTFQKHVSFASTPTVSDTPFTSTLNYFKSLKHQASSKFKGQSKGKENSPNKSRRNASLPEEIAELAKEVQSEDDYDLDGYRDIDLAPLDPVLENEGAGDLIMVKSASPVNIQKGDWKKKKMETSAEKIMLDQLTPNKAKTYELDIPGHYGDAFKVQIETNASETDIANYIRQRGTELEAKQDEIEKAVESFLDKPSSFIVDEGDVDVKVESEDKMQQQEHPVFIRVISIIPVAMFWTTIGAVAHYADKAYEAVVNKLKGFSI